MLYIPYILGYIRARNALFIAVAGLRAVRCLVNQRLWLELNTILIARCGRLINQRGLRESYLGKTKPIYACNAETLRKSTDLLSARFRAIVETRSRFKTRPKNARNSNFSASCSFGSSPLPSSLLLSPSVYPLAFWATKMFALWRRPHCGKTGARREAWQGAA